MNNFIKYISLLILATFSLNTFAEDKVSLAKDSGFFVGGSLGIASLDFDDQKSIDKTAANGITMSSVDVDDENAGVKVFGGYNFNQYFGIEGGYVYLGEYDSTFNITAPVAEASAVNSDVYGLMFAGVASFPITNNAKLFGKLGLFRWESDSSINSNLYAVVDDDGTDVMFGLGANYKVTDNALMRIEWERYALDKSDIDLFSIGMQYNF